MNAAGYTQARRMHAFHEIEGLQSSIGSAVFWTSAFRLEAGAADRFLYAVANTQASTDIRSDQLQSSQQLMFNLHEKQLRVLGSQRAGLT